MLRQMQTLQKTQDESANLSVEAVRSFYEKHQYPNYPLFAKPLWQEGYLTSSLFAQAVTRSSSPQNPRRVLITGAGEILPYIIRRWEPKSNHVTALDLSKASLRRAKWRCLGMTRPMRFIAADLNQFLVSKNNSGSASFDHIDSYGVLHHLPDPLLTLSALAKQLKPGGTMRLMVYNTEARSWIHEIQHVLRHFHADFANASDIEWAGKFLKEAASLLPNLRQKLEQMGPTLLKNPARFADTFLHPREARISYKAWTQTATQCGLKVSGLLDRYGELDELPNPLWQLPEEKILSTRSETGEFEGNWELFLCKDGLLETKAAATQGNGRTPLHLLLKPSPRLWWSFEETVRVSHVDRGQLWSLFLTYIHGNHRAVDDGMRKWIQTHPIKASQRLARLGAILPGMVKDQKFHERLMEPLQKTPTAADVRLKEEITASGNIELIKSLIDNHSEQRGVSAKKRELIFTRMCRSGF